MTGKQRAAAPWSFHNWWGRYDTPADLPNTAGAALQLADVQAGDEAWSLLDGQPYVCQDPALGAAVWFALASSVVAGQQLYVDYALGDDANPGTAASPLKTIAEAESRIPDIVKGEVVISVQPHTGAGYVWPTFRTRLFSGAGAGIWVIFPEVNEMATGTIVSTVGAEWIVTGGGLTPGLWDGKTIEILDGPAQYDRRTIRNNDTVNIYPTVEFTTDPGTANFRIIEPNAGNRVIPDLYAPMVQGTNGPETGGPIGHVLDGDPGLYVPGLNIVNAILAVSDDVVFTADARLAMFGCEGFNDSLTFVRYHGSGQVLMGRHAWNAVRPPSTESQLSTSSWIGWGVNFTGGHYVLWLDSVPHVSGYVVTQERYVAGGGVHQINGHIKGTLRLLGRNNGSDIDQVLVSFGKAAPFTSVPQANPGKISADVAAPNFAAASAQVDAHLHLHDETMITNLGTGAVMLATTGGKIFCNLQIRIEGTNGGDGLAVKKGGQIVVTNLTSHASIDLIGTVAGQLFSIGPRSTDATMANDFNVSGDFVSGARAFWDAGLVVTSHIVTLTTIGAVIAVEATVGNGVGPKLIQRSATPGTGAVQVTYDTSGFATLTFNNTDAVTECDVYVQPEDDGTLVRAV